MDPQFIDPEHGDYRVAAGSPAAGYGCRTFASQAGLRLCTDALRTARGPVAVDTFWGEDTVRVTGDVFVADGSTLYIAPGVTVLFEGWYSIFVRGRLLAAGTPLLPIRFDSARPDLWAPDSSLCGAWAGLRFDGTRAANGASRLEWCEVRHTKGLAGRDRGGAISMIGCSNLVVRNSVFRENAAQYGAVLYCERMACPALVGNLMVENYAFTGGSAVYCIDSYPRLFENTITGNTCLNSDGSYATGAVHNHMGKAWLAGNIVYGNPSQYFISMQMREPKPFCVRYCDVQYGLGGEGDFDADPRFAGGGSHPHALDAASPCRDAGPADTTGHGLAVVDLAGWNRTAGARIDVGAYEWADPAAVEEGTGGGDVSGGPAVRVAAASNPAIRPVSIELTIREAADHLRVVVVSAAGRRIRSLFEGSVRAGSATIVWDGRTDGGRKAVAGAYWILAETGMCKAHTRVLLMDPAR
jgi:hypothetical protein